MVKKEHGMELHTDTFFAVADNQYDCNFINVFYLAYFLSIQTKAPSI